MTASIHRTSRQVRALAAGMLLVLLSQTCPGAEVKKDIEYGRAGEARLLLDAGIPDGPGPFPAVIVVHGGGWNSGDKQADPAPLLRALTESGSFTWFSINYRLAPANRWPAC